MRCVNRCVPACPAWFTIIICLGLALWAGPVHATVYFDDSFEGNSPLDSGWAYNSGACGGSPCVYLNVSTEQAHSGAKSLRGFYPSGALLNEAGTWNQAIAHGIPPSTEVYVRYWYRTSGFLYGPTTGTKHIYWKGAQASHKPSPNRPATRNELYC